MLSKVLVFVALVFLAGCAPSHSAWVTNLDGAKEAPLDSLTYLRDLLPMTWEMLEFVLVARQSEPSV